MISGAVVSLVLSSIAPSLVAKIVVPIILSLCQKVGVKADPGAVRQLVKEGASHLVSGGKELTEREHEMVAEHRRRTVAELGLPGGT